MTDPALRKRATVIAEIGENHTGDWKMARQMVVEAARAGADLIKGQSFSAGAVSDKDPEKEWFAKVELPDEVHHELKQAAEENGAQFLSAPFTLNRARFLCEELGLKKIKIASSEMLNFPLLDYVAEYAEAVYLSTGLATLDEIREALAHLTGVARIAILHCVTAYPTPDDQANLSAIATLRDAFPQHEIGYSDHTLGITAGVAAVALGATVVEKHFTLDKNLPGTDHILSATPAELTAMVRMIRRVETLLGQPEKSPTPQEKEVLAFVRQRFPKDGSA